VINSPGSRRYLIVVTSAALLTTGLVAPAIAGAASANLYVASVGADTNACTTAAEPCQTINHAISLAANSGTTIHLAQGQFFGASPGSKNVTIVGVGPDKVTGSVITGLGAAVVVNDSAAVLTLKSLALDADEAGAYVTAGKLTTSHVSLFDTPCALYMTGGRVTLTDTAIDKSGITGRSDCSPLTSSPVAVTINGGTLSFVRSSLTDTKGEPGMVINGGTFSATDSVFSDPTYYQSNPNATVQNAGGTATIKRSLVTFSGSGLELTGGNTTVADSTFAGDGIGIVTTGVVDYPFVFRSTFVDAPLSGPAALAGDVLSSNSQNVCTEQVMDLGYNYETGGSCTFSAATSRNGAATMNLDHMLVDHGGPTQLVAVSAPSALIDVIPVGATWGPEHHKLCPAGTTDQRGLARPQGSACDAGAFEVAASQTAVTAAPDPAAPGATVNLAAKITPRAATFHDPDAITGTVTFKNGTTTLCSNSPVSSAGVAACATKALPAGTPTVTATFTSASPYLGSSGTANPVIGTTPKITSPSTATATIGKKTTITIRWSGAPAPTITKTSGTLPRGMTFTGGKGSATLTGTAARGTAKNYALHLRASNARGSVNQTFTLKVVPS
jgi:hypothetical protein